MFVRLMRNPNIYRRMINPSQQRANFSIWNMFKRTKAGEVNPIMKLFSENTPFFFNTNAVNHHDIQQKTIESVIDVNKFHELLTHAKQNLALWSTNKQPSPLRVDVIRSDWGDAGQENTAKYGHEYAILNMANAFFAGGDFLGGGSAQEENMWARTTCMHWLAEDPNSVYIDNETHAYRYKQAKSDLINAKVMMTDEELKKLSIICGKAIPSAYKIHMDTAEPEVCFRGPELFYQPQGSAFDGSTTSNRVALDVFAGSFRFLPAKDIFPFHELRSAAIDLTDTNIKVNWEDERFVAWFKHETKQRIDAQLDTALLNGIRHVILGAFGCGAFKNKPEIVAEIYRASIAERASHFEHIVFAIYHPGYGLDNFPAFHQALNGIALGQNAAVANTYQSPGLGRASE